jgi:hypothetical protein
VRLFFSVLLFFFLFFSLLTHLPSTCAARRSIRSLLPPPATNPTDQPTSKQTNKKSKLFSCSGNFCFVRFGGNDRAAQASRGVPRRFSNPMLHKRHEQLSTVQRTGGVPFSSPLLALGSSAPVCFQVLTILGEIGRRQGRVSFLRLPSELVFVDPLASSRFDLMHIAATSVPQFFLFLSKFNVVCGAREHMAKKQQKKKRRNFRKQREKLN